MATIKQTDSNRVREVKLKHPTLLLGMQTGLAFDTAWQLSKPLNTECQHGTKQFHSWVNTQEKWKHVWRPAAAGSMYTVCTGMLTVASVTAAQEQKWHKRPSMDKQINEMWAYIPVWNIIVIRRSSDTCYHGWQRKQIVQSKGRVLHNSISKKYPG